MQTREAEVSILLSEPEVIANNPFQELSKEYAKLHEIVTLYQQHQDNTDALAAAELMLQEHDAELQELAMEEMTVLQAAQEVVVQSIKTALIPEDPDDHRNIYLEIRAGTGGDEAAIFAGDLYRMYSRFAEKNRWSIEIVNVKMLTKVVSKKLL